MLTGQSVTTYEKFPDGDFLSNPYFNNFTYKIHKFFLKETKAIFFQINFQKFSKKRVYFGENTTLSLYLLLRTISFVFCILLTKTYFQSQNDSRVSNVGSYLCMFVCNAFSKNLINGLSQQLTFSIINFLIN